MSGYPRQPEPSSEPLTVTWDEETWRVWRELSPMRRIKRPRLVTVPLRQTGPDTWEATYTYTISDA